MRKATENSKCFAKFLIRQVPSPYRDEQRSNTAKIVANQQVLRGAWGRFHYQHQAGS